MRFDLKTVTAACALLIVTTTAGFAAEPKVHRVSIQVDQNDPAVMNLALNNATNIMETFKEKGEEVEIELVTYGPGLNMLRDDTSPVKDRLKQIAELSFPAKIKFSACNITKRGMEKREGHPIPIVAEAGMVPSGAVRLMELQESGWSYLKP
ncbi:DsrE family protein [Bradyrhizobium sp. HKCCYLS2038]|uniref:DsrE family protein n=1 Tax=unclassified Bradyrhizobium TaxID=2631580 RepID=UPI003EB73159